jgi:tRNA pseudouridine55 synthase
MENKFVEGEVLLINKPLTWTSFNVVKKIENILRKHFSLKKIKVGHAGTLDPLASGLLIVCTGKATKQITSYQEQEKEYIAGLLIGKTTPSFDLETEFDQEFPTEHISRELVEKVLASFIGEADQIPPIFSAKLFEGKRAYEYARKGKSVELKPNHITISQIDLLSYNFPEITINIKCSKGTYIRSLVRDIGTSLDSGATMIALQRTAIGPYSLNNAITIEEFQNKLALL